MCAAKVEERSPFFDCTSRIREKIGKLQSKLQPIISEHPMCDGKTEGYGTKMMSEMQEIESQIDSLLETIVL